MEDRKQNDGQKKRTMGKPKQMDHGRDETWEEGDCSYVERVGGEGVCHKFNNIARYSQPRTCDQSGLWCNTHALPFHDSGSLTGLSTATDVIICESPLRRE